MKISVRTIYKCEHCGKNYFIKSACEKHETICFKNETNKRKCFGCEHLKKEVLPYHYDTGFGEGVRNVSVFFCEKIDSALYPPHTKDPFEFGDESNQEMKKECEHFKDENELMDIFKQ